MGVAGLEKRQQYYQDADRLYEEAKAAEAGNPQAAFKIAVSIQKKYKALNSAHDQVKKYAEIAYKKGIVVAGVTLAKNCWYTADYTSKISDKEKKNCIKRQKNIFWKQKRKELLMQK